MSPPMTIWNAKTMEFETKDFNRKVLWDRQNHKRMNSIIFGENDTYLMNHNG